MTEFKPGDKVKFTDKYGKLQRGIYESLGSYPAIGEGGKMTEFPSDIVKARPFADLGNDSEILCSCGIGNLELDT